MLGAEEFLYNKKKFCLWISDDKLDFALGIPEVRDRIEKTKQYREGKNAFGSKDPVAIPHQFLKMKMAKKIWHICSNGNFRKKGLSPDRYF